MPRFFINARGPVPSRCGRWDLNPTPSGDVTRTTPFFFKHFLVLGEIIHSPFVDHVFLLTNAKIVAVSTQSHINKYYEFKLCAY
jgi:hypothetical protein